MKAVEWWLPPEKRTPPPKKRKPYKLSGEPYQKGVKEYLASFEVGEERVFDGRFQNNSLRAIASKLRRDFGVQYSFRIIDGVRKVRRLK